MLVISKLSLPKQANEDTKKTISVIKKNRVSSSHKRVIKLDTKTSQEKKTWKIEFWPLNLQALYPVLIHGVVNILDQLYQFDL